MKIGLQKIENQLNHKTTNLEDYGMFVSPKGLAFWSKMDAEMERFNEEYSKAQEELECKQCEGYVAMITIDPVTNLPVVASYMPKPKEADRGTKAMFWLAMVSLGITIVGLATYFIF